MISRKSLAGLLVLLLALAGVTLLGLWTGRVQAQTDEPYTPSGIPVSELGDEIPPGRLNVRFPRRSPEQVDRTIRRALQRSQRPGPPSARPFAVQTVPTITAEIQTLATGLENDPLAIYNYVHQHIDYVPSWGLLKNPRETLLSGVGNAFDQAALLNGLLSAAGYPTRYVWGTIEISKTTAMNWVGVTDPDVVAYVFANGGVPTAEGGDFLQLSHVWIEVFDDGAWHSLDPSFKRYIEQPGEDLRPLLGYTDLSAFVARAESGITLTADYVQNLNQANIRTDMVSYTMNLMDHLRDDEPFVYLEDLVGARQIEQAETVTYALPLSYTVVTTSGTASDVPNSLAYTLTVQLPGLDYTAHVDDIAGERMTIFYECATSADCQRLEDGGGVYDVYPAYQVNVVPKLRVGGEVVATGSISVPLGTWGQPLTVTVDTPSLGSFPTTQSLVAGAWYALPMRLQSVSSRALSRHARLLDEALAQGAGPDDEPVLGQILNLMGLSYFNQVELGDRIDGRIAEVVQVPHFSLMIVSRNLTIYVDSMERPVDLDPASHTVDVRLSLDSVSSAQNPASDERERAWFVSAGMRGSAVEHAIIEQLRSIPAISTIQALHLATEAGQRMYYVTPSNWSAVSAELGHSTPVLNAIVAALNSGRHVVISQDPITYGQWTGSGWISLDPDSGSAAYMISGGLGSTEEPVSLAIDGGSGFRSEEQLGTPQGREEDVSRTQLIQTGMTQNRDMGLARHPEGFTEDPIDVTTGEFVYHYQDLASLGGLGIPLGFERFYASFQHNVTGTLGYGWSHTYNTRFYTHTNWVRGLGGRMALEAAPALASAQVGIDLFDLASIPHQRYAMDVTVAQWLMAQITGNTVTLIESDGAAATYLRLSDGAYQPPPGRGNLEMVTTYGDGSATLDWEDGTQTQFNADGRPTILEDANGNRTTLSYDGQERLVQVSDAVTRTLTLTYNVRGLLSQVVDPAGRVLGFNYDDQGNLRTYIDPQGGVITYTYDADHRLTSVTDQIGTTYVINQYDALGRVVTQTNGRGGETGLRYAGDRTFVSGPLGHQTTYAYDERGRLVSIEDGLGHRRTMGYDAADHQVSRTNGLSETFTFAYDAWSHLTAVTDSLGHTLRWTYDDAGHPVGHIDRRGKGWQFTYDEQHNLTAVTDPLGDTTVYTYTDHGQVTQVLDAAGISVTYSYDVHGSPACVTNGLGEASCWAYDVVGRPISLTTGTGDTYQFLHDAGDHLRQITDPLGYQTRYGYNAVGSMVAITDANEHATTFAYDAQFNLTHVTDTLGQVTAYAYDANDNLAAITDTLGHATTYQRDAVGRVITVTDPLSRSVGFHYDAADRVVGFVRADGSVINYQRDEMGRLTGIDYPTGPDVAHGHDAAGNLISATYGSGWNVAYGYDDAGQLSEVVDHVRGLTLTYTYDPAGRRTGMRANRAGTTLYDVSYAYDAAARLAALTDQAASPTATVGFGYDAGGRMAQIVDPGGSRADYAYDPAGRLVSIGHHDTEGNNIATYAYVYDAGGNPTVVTETTPVGAFTTGYTYDPLNRLTAEIYRRYAISYTYDAVGNLIRRVDPLGTLDYIYDKADQMQSRGSERFDYDEHGNLTTWQNTRGTYTYTYDYDNRLTDLTPPVGTPLAFTYDSFGRRLAIQGAVETRTFLHDGLDIIMEGDSGLSQTDDRYLYGNGLLVARHTDQLDFTAYHGDSQANIRYLLDGAGRAFDAYRSDAYGRPAHPTGMDPTPFRFAGQQSAYRHELSGWPGVLMGFRYYDPGSGRFLTRDPWPGDRLYPPTLNDYTYAWSNPTRYSDPTGLRVAFGGEELRDQPLGAQTPSPGERANMPFLDRDLKRTHGASAVGQPGEETSAHQSRPPAGRSEQPGRPLLWWLEKRYRKWQEKLLRWKRIEQHGQEWLGLPSGNRTIYQEASSLDALQSGPSQWMSTFDQGSTYALACTAEDQLLAGAFQAGLFSSADAGHAVWQQADTAGVGEIAIGDADVYYAGARYGGALKSNDGGQSWTPINDNLTANDVYALAIDPDTSDHVFAGTEMGLFVSDDGGTNWDRPAGTLPGRLVSDLAFAGDILLVVTDFGLYRSDDGAASWLTPTVDLPLARINTLFVISPTSTVYAGTARGLYRSTDSGDTWSTWGTGLTGRDIHALAVDPTDADHMIAGTTSGLFVSTDGGDSWEADAHLGLDGIASLVGALAFCPEGGDANLYLGAGGGVYAFRVPMSPAAVTIDGTKTGVVHTGYAFTATVSPLTVTRPLTYVWEATDQASVTHTAVSSLKDTTPFTWHTPGPKTITVTVSNGLGMTRTHHTIVVNVPPADVNVDGPTAGVVDTPYDFTAQVEPVTTTQPITYVWQATGQSTVTDTHVYSVTHAQSYTWSTPGPKTITVTVDNGSGVSQVTHIIVIAEAPEPPSWVAIAGPTDGVIHARYTFTATVRPLTTTQPITYVWEATGQVSTTHAAVNNLTDTVPFTWHTLGPKTITVTVNNSAGVTGTAHTIVVNVPPVAVSVGGSTAGVVDTSYDFTAQVYPVTTTQPITYVWQATGQSTVTDTHVYSVTHAQSFTWPTPGPKAVTITVDNGSGASQVTHIIAIVEAPELPSRVAIAGPTAGVIHARYIFTATVRPLTTTQPITYVWEATDQVSTTHAAVDGLADTTFFTWQTPGPKTVTVTVDNGAGLLSATHAITITTEADFQVYLPLILRKQRGRIVLSEHR